MSQPAVIVHVFLTIAPYLVHYHARQTCPIERRCRDGPKLRPPSVPITVPNAQPARYLE